MPMYEDLAARIRSSDEADKEIAADEIADLAKNMTEEERSTVAILLVDVLMQSTSEKFREAALNALCELDEWGNVSGEVLSKLEVLAGMELGPSAREHLDALVGRRIT